MYAMCVDGWILQLDVCIDLESPVSTTVNWWFQKMSNHIKLDNGITHHIHMLLRYMHDIHIYSIIQMLLKNGCMLGFHSLTCFNTPTSNSSTLCWIPLDVSINFASMDLANALPSAVGMTRERACWKKFVDENKLIFFHGYHLTMYAYIFFSSH